jgi:hypothetical protein
VRGGVAIAVSAMTLTSVYAGGVGNLNCVRGAGSVNCVGQWGPAAIPTRKFSSVISIRVATGVGRLATVAFPFHRPSGKTYLIGRFGIALNLSQTRVARDRRDLMCGTSRFRQSPARCLAQPVRTAMT